MLDRFEEPLYTVGESARYLDVPVSTFRNWAHGYPYRRTDGREIIAPPVLTTVPSSARRRPVVPFIGLAEGYVLTAIRRSGVPLQRVRPAIERLDVELGLAHALASRRLYTDGAEVLYDYATSGHDEGVAEAARDLVVVRNGQRRLQRGGGRIPEAARVRGRRLRLHDPAPGIRRRGVDRRAVPRLRTTDLRPRWRPARRRAGSLPSRRAARGRGRRVRDPSRPARRRGARRDATGGVR